MEKKSKANLSNNSRGRKIDGINIKRDIEIFRPGKKNEKDFDNFYTELDKKRKSKKPFIWSMAFVLLIFFLLVVYGLWAVRNSFQKNGIIADNAKQQTYLTEQVAEGLSGKKTGDSLTVPITEEELANFIGVGTNDFPIKKSTLEIKDDGIYISGRTGDSFFSFPVTIVANPSAENGKLKVELSKASSGIVTLPLSIKNALNDYFANKVDMYTSDIGRIEVKEVVLKNHTMTLIGTAL
jgi:uncharacterized protein YpmS